VKAIDQAGHESVTSSQVSVEASSWVLPGPLQSIPLLLPAIVLSFLLIGVAAMRRRLLSREQVRQRSPRVERREEETGEEDEISDL